MTIGNWRSHLLIKCAVCSKLMGHHKPSTTATCVDCDKSEQVRIYMNETRHRLKKESTKGLNHASTSNF